MHYQFNDAEINYILNLLADQPFRDSADLINKIHQQYDQQIEKEKQQSSE